MHYLISCIMAHFYILLTLLVDGIFGEKGCGDGYHCTGRLDVGWGPGRNPTETLQDEPQTGQQAINRNRLHKERVQRDLLIRPASYSAHDQSDSEDEQHTEGGQVKA